MAAGLDCEQARAFLDATWDTTIVPTLSEYIRIPNMSPAFDKEWATNGLMDSAVELVVAWVRAQQIEGLTVRVVREEGRTPVVLAVLPGSPGADERNVLMYMHLDKQPPMTGWDEGLDPYVPVIRDGKLYGRGGADDGYGIFAAVAALGAVQAQGLPLPRIVLLAETCEESGSLDLAHYVTALATEIGTPDLVVCLDSGAANYDQLWATTSLRGNVLLTVGVEVLTEGVHSGAASGVVPSSFRVLRALLDRLEDSTTGAMVEGFTVAIPSERRAQAEAAVAVLGDLVWDEFPWAAGVHAGGRDNVELMLAKTWRPTLSVLGADGLPEVTRAGNVLRPMTALRLGVRTPPTASAPDVLALATRLLTESPPYGAKVTVSNTRAASGWCAPPESPALSASLERASQTFFGKPIGYMGEGGSIPFLGMLGTLFPAAQFVVTGVLGPKSNAHGPNEFIDISYAKKLNACIALVLSEFAHVPKGESAPDAAHVGHKRAAEEAAAGEKRPRNL